MLKKSILHTALWLLLFSTATFAQTSQQADSTRNQQDPFKNDPFFSQPLNNLLKRPPIDKDDKDDDSTDKKWGGYHHYWDRINEEGLDFGGSLEAGPYSSSALYGIYPNLPMIHYNRVDALFLGIRMERMQWYGHDDLLGIPGISPHGMLGYSFGLKEWQYTLGLEKYIGRRRHIMIGGEYHSATTTDDYWRAGLTETSITSFLAGYDYLDYYKQRGMGLYALIRTDRLFEGGVAFNDDRYTSLAVQSDWALFGAGGKYRPNPPVDVINGSPIDTLDISALTFSASFNPKRLVLAPHFTFAIHGELEIADPGIGTSDYNYDRYQAEVLAFVNFERGGILKNRLRIGAISGQAPLFKQFQLGGIGSMRALPYKSLPVNSFGGNEMILNTTEVHFGQPSWGSTDWIDFGDIYVSLFLDTGWANYNQDLEDTKSLSSAFSSFRFSDLKYNAGFGIGTSSLRFEIAWDLNNAGRAPVFWIRLNPTF